MDMVALLLHLLLLHSLWSSHCLGCHLAMEPIPSAPWNSRFALECIYLAVGLGMGWRGLLRIPRLWLQQNKPRVRCLLMGTCLLITGLEENSTCFREYSFSLCLDVMVIVGLP